MSFQLVHSTNFILQIILQILKFIIYIYIYIEKLNFLINIDSVVGFFF